ncbi:MAG: hypothetical protein AAFN93_18910 [Bacteroidota bacterium]
MRKAWREIKKANKTLFIKKGDEPATTLSNNEGEEYETGDIPQEALDASSTPGEGWDAVMTINPDLHESVLNAIDSDESGPRGFLGGHETYHGLELVTGNNIRGDLNNNYLKDTEERASHFENLVRKDLDKNANLRKTNPTEIGTKPLGLDYKSVNPFKKPILKPIPIKVPIQKKGFDYSNRTLRRKEAKKIVRNMNKKR